MNFKKHFYQFLERAYHGTPYKIEGGKFDLGKVGSGEGAQAYGWGLYFAEEKKVASGYKSVVPNQSVSPIRTLDGFEVKPQTPAYHVSTLLDGDNTIASVTREIKRWIATTDPIRTKDIQHYRDMLDIITRFNSKKYYKRKRPKGNLYSVEINVKPNEFLKWDENLASQTQKVQQLISQDFYPQKVPNLEIRDLIRNAVRLGATTGYHDVLVTLENNSDSSDKLLQIAQRTATPEKYQRFLNGEEEYSDFVLEPYKEYIEYKVNPDMGEWYYKKLSAKLGSAKAASLYLLSKGIKGIVYRDGFSRAASDRDRLETRNYVIFDDSLIQIQSENGKKIKADSVEGSDTLTVGNKEVTIQSP